MLKVKNLFHRYPRNEKFAVNDVNFEISEGEIFGFLGPSGAGKSTVQNILIGLLPLQKGEVFFGGKKSTEIKKEHFNKVGVSFELPNLFEKLSGLENLKYYAGLFDVETEDPKQMLNRVGLGADAAKRAGQYSKGMKQRLVFARAIMNRPEYLFLDEPLAGLDPSTAQEIKKIIVEQKERGAAIFLTTHNMFVAEELCDRVGFINEGKLVALDTPRNLKLQYGKRSVKVEFQREGKHYQEVLFFDNPAEKQRLQQIISDYEIIMMHSGEATLEEIFVKLTGRRLSTS